MKLSLKVLIFWFGTNLVHAQDERPGARDCKELQDEGKLFSDWYTIFPDGSTPLKVFCDMHTDGGGWIVFQRRCDGLVDFSRDWNSYKIGFGDRMNEFWLGNENLYTITSLGSWTLRVDFQNFEYTNSFATYDSFTVLGESEKYRLLLGAFTGGNAGSWTLRVDFQNFEYTNSFATYDSFTVLGESEKYRLLLGAFTGGNAGDSMTYHHNKKFSTMDQDNDLRSENCAQKYKGGWWYSSCRHAYLNGLYFPGKYNNNPRNGIVWKSGEGWNYSYKHTEMKIRPNKIKT